MNKRRSMILVATLSLSLASIAEAGDLGNMARTAAGQPAPSSEQYRRPQPSSASASSTSSSRASEPSRDSERDARAPLATPQMSASDHARFYGGTRDRSTSSSWSSESDTADSLSTDLNLWPFCFVPPLSGFCLGGEAALSTSPYSGWMYTVDAEKQRRAEFRMGGFAAGKGGIWGSEVDVRGWLYPAFVEGRWSTLFENHERKDIDTLHVGRARVGTNIRLGQAGEFTTAAGVTALVGGKDPVVGFNAAVGVRVYPMKPFVFAAEAEMTLFDFDGNMLYEWRAEPGVSFGAFEIRAGVRHIVQPGVVSLLGPSLTLSARL